MANIDYKLTLDVEATFPEVLGYLRTEEIYKYVDGKKSDILEGFKVYVMDFNTMSEVAIKVLGDVPEFGKMEPVVFENLEVVPYIKRSGNFSNLEYSVKATGVHSAK